MNKMNGNPSVLFTVNSGMHTYPFILLSEDDMRQIAGGTGPTELPTLPPVRNSEDYDPAALKESNSSPGPQVPAPGLDVAEMMRKS